MIEIKDVTYKYKNGTKAIENLNLEINDGEFIAIIGKNGSGKSTLGKLIAGLLRPSQGEILVNGINTKNKKEQIDLRKNVGIVFQNPENQIVFNRVYDDLAFGMKNIGTDPKDIKSIIEHCLEKVDMSEYKRSESYDLSLGQKQRVVIAGVLSMNPKILVLDEPTTMLDPEGKQKVYDVLKKLQTQGYTIVYITNIIDETMFADKIIILEKGHLVEQFLSKQMLEKAERLQELGIELPKTIKLYQRLKKQGHDVNYEDFI